MSSDSYDDFASRYDQPDSHRLAKFVPIDTTPKAVRYVVQRFIAEGVVLIAGHPAVGKTSGVLPLAMAQAGLHEPGYPHGPAFSDRWRHVVYITEDLDQAQRIITGMLALRQFDIELAAQRLHLVEAVRMDAAAFVRVKADYSHLWATDSGVMLPPLVVVDTKSAVFDLEDENSNAQTSELIATLKQQFSGIPIWVIGHLAKGELTRANAAEMSMRGASSAGGDAHQTLFVVPDGESRYLVRGKTRFVSPWPELELCMRRYVVPAKNRWGEVEETPVVWGVATVPELSREQRKAEQQRADEDLRKAQLADDERLTRGEVLDAVATAWNTGNPLSRSGVEAKVRRKHSAVRMAVELLLAEGWLIEITVPLRQRINARKQAYLVSLTAEQRASKEVPSELLLMPETWAKTADFVPPRSAPNTH